MLEFSVRRFYRGVSAVTRPLGRFIENSFFPLVSEGVPVLDSPLSLCPLRFSLVRRS